MDIISLILTVISIAIIIVITTIVYSLLRQTINRQIISSEPITPREEPIALDSLFYIERPPIESDCYQLIQQPGALIRIKAARQMGKTSLLIRISDVAKKQGYATATIDFNLADKSVFENLEKFLKWICIELSSQLGLPNSVDRYWSEILSSKTNFDRYLKEYLLTEIAFGLVLAFDNIDHLAISPHIYRDFFALLRSIHEYAKIREIYKLKLIVIHCQEFYFDLPIHESPFNVGMLIRLPEFTLEQMQDLAKRYKLALEAEEIQQLMDLVGGHPYLVNLALSCLSDRKMNFKQFLQTAITDRGIYQEHLQYYLQLLMQKPKLLADFKKLIKAEHLVELERSRIYDLENMGLIKCTRNRASIRCELYREYFKYRL